MIKHFLSFLLVIFFIASCGSSNPIKLTDKTLEGTKRPLGVWIKSTRTFDSNLSTNQTFGTLSSRGIKHIDQLIRMQQNEDKSFSIINESLLADFIYTAYSEGVTVNLFLEGNNLFNENNHKDTLSKLESIIDFNRNLYISKGITIFGIKYRVDLEQSTDWANNKESAIYNYLYYLKKAKTLLERENSTIKISVDTNSAWASSNYIISFDREEKSFSSHIIDIVDYITILSFSRSGDVTYSMISDELQYVRDEQFTYRVVPAMAVSPLLNSTTSFYGVDSTIFWRELDKLQEWVSQDKRVGMLIMIEDFDYLDQIPPIPAK
ncbi:hypothetical protein MNB_SV-15-1248 [hydrothermal vent metagenome]|uniref:Uncharacterized protein n=1 Tax=hydrothermal vent metagenome TaxID=652676 RepID=A0A1W1ELN4_9ZZZZ